MRPLLLAIASVILLVAAPVAYSRYIEYDYERRCLTSQKMRVIDERALRELASLVETEAPRLGRRFWSDVIAEQGYEIEDIPFGLIEWKVGVTERPIAIRKHGRQIASVYNVVLNRPDWAAFLGVNYSPHDGTCAYGHSDIYPDFWRQMHRIGRKP